MAAARPLIWGGFARCGRAEESPGSMETRCRITSGGGDPRESATESKPPASARVRVKGCGKSAPRGLATGAARQTPPGARPNRGGMKAKVFSEGTSLQVRFQTAARVGCTRRAATRVPDEWPSRGGNPAHRTRLTGRLTFSFLSHEASAIFKKESICHAVSPRAVHLDDSFQFKKLSIMRGVT